MKSAGSVQVFQTDQHGIMSLDWLTQSAGEMETRAAGGDAESWRWTEPLPEDEEPEISEQLDEQLDVLADDPPQQTEAGVAHDDGQLDDDDGHTEDKDEDDSSKKDKGDGKQKDKGVNKKGKGVGKKDKGVGKQTGKGGNKAADQSKKGKGNKGKGKTGIKKETDKPDAPAGTARGKGKGKGRPRRAEPESDSQSDQASKRAKLACSIMRRPAAAGATRAGLRTFAGSPAPASQGLRIAHAVCVSVWDAAGAHRALKDFPGGPHRAQQALLREVKDSMYKALETSEVPPDATCCTEMLKAIAQTAADCWMSSALVEMMPAPPVAEAPPADSPAGGASPCEAPDAAAEGSALRG